LSEAAPRLAAENKANRVAGFARSERARPVAPLTGQALSEAGETPALPS